MMVESQTLESFEEIPPKFNLQRKLGSKAIKLFTAEKIQAAEDIISTFAPEFRKDISERLKNITDLVRERKAGSKVQIWTHAHEIRGMAGIAGIPELGKIGDLFCHYLNDSKEDFLPDPNLITSITTAASYIINDNSNDSETIGALISDCELAVIAQRKREGRGEFDL